MSIDVSYIVRAIGVLLETGHFYFKIFLYNIEFLLRFDAFDQLGNPCLFETAFYMYLHSHLSLVTTKPSFCHRTKN